jgi:hypothetical protein
MQLNNQKSLPLRNNSNVNSFKSLLKSSNPSELIQNLISQNPKMKSVMQLMQNSGKTPKEFFYNYAKEQGINPDQFINSLMQE